MPVKNIYESTEKKRNREKRCTLKVAVICAVVTAILTGAVASSITWILLKDSQCAQPIVKTNQDLDFPELRHRALRECLDATEQTKIEATDIIATNNIGVKDCLAKTNMIDSIGINVTKTMPHLQDTCPSGDYLLVRRNDIVNDSDSHVRPMCAQIVIGILTEQLLYSREHCFNLACKSNANVVYYDPKVECAAYKCESDSNELDWEYKWTYAAPATGRTYARPHSSAKPCHNSHFMKRSLANVRATCFSISYTTVETESVSECMEKACSDKANTFNVISLRSNLMKCETQHCGWDVIKDDYVFNLRQNEHGLSQVYSLSHIFKPCKNLLKTQPVELPNNVPGKCGSPGYFDRNLAISTEQEIPNDFCESGSNTFVEQKGDKKYLAYKCNSNHEGTNWAFYDNNCYGDSVFSKWWIVPYPGTPNCKSDMFTLRRMGASCQKSNCDSSGSKKVSTARDLRQCMLHACEKGYNVINYFSNATVVLCELRNCSRSEDNDYDFQYQTTGGIHGYDLYALQPDSICRSQTSNHLYAKYTSSYYAKPDKT
ncbi:unnamed protein product [Owenia fusiformis]|uniref:Uncharacterized protein n=1 Tax=Owenia fusiformis TaxID=6347 RepID=A0A8S4Q6B3_OWEFU|nr:unnamed protein product [Owenia fusiformis]